MQIDFTLIIQALFFGVLIWFFIYNGILKNSNLSKSFSSIILWILIFCILIVVYAFRFELSFFKNRILAVLVPSYSWTNAKNELVVARNQDGHFYINAVLANNKTITFLVDTGATDIAITQQDAIKLGLNTQDLLYTKRYRTANGITMAAPIKIRELTIGKKTFYNLSAHVTSGDLEISLLGMSAIDDFKHFTIKNDLLKLGSH